MKRTIRDIKIDKKQPARRQPLKTKTRVSDESPETTEKPAVSRRASKHSHKNSRGGRGFLWLIVAVIVIVAGLWIAGRFHKSIIKVIPDRSDVDIDTTVTAERDAGNNELRFDVMVVEESLDEILEATSSEHVERRASGTIVIFNEGSSEQKLREETRFETPDGLIFKLAKGKGVTLPAAKNGIPGQVEAVVYADEVGSDYNVELTDFTIPGWKEIDNPKFKTQYARSKTKMTGGFVGEDRGVDPEAEIALRGTLRSKLLERLLDGAQSQKTDEFIFFSEGMNTSFAEGAYEPVENDSVKIIESGSLSVVLLHKEEFSTFLAERTWDDYDGNPVVITNLEELAISFEDMDSFDSQETSSVRITVNGRANFEFVIPKDDIKSALQGTSRKDFQSILGSFAGVSRAELNMRPFWKMRIPENLEKIKINIGRSNS